MQNNAYMRLKRSYYVEVTGCMEIATRIVVKNKLGS